VPKSERLVQGHLGYNDQVHFVRFSPNSPNSKRIVSASPLRDVCVWNADAGALVSGPSLWHMEGALAVMFRPKNAYSPVSSDGKWIVVHNKNSMCGIPRQGNLQCHLKDTPTKLILSSFHQTASISS